MTNELLIDVYVVSTAKAVVGTPNHDSGRVDITHFEQW